MNTAMELYHYRCKNTLGVWGQSPHVLAQQVLYHENATGWLTFSALKDLALQKECKIEEGHLMPDHIHILISIPPKYSVSQVVGFIKGKSAISIARTYMGRRKNFTGQSFWARGYYVSTVGRDEETVRNYIKHQEDEDKRIDQLDLF